MRFLLTRRRRGIPAMGTLRNVLRGHDGPWRQVEVLQGSRVQLQNGLICTKDRPTSMPTTRDQSSWPSVSSVAGRQGRWKTSEKALLQGEGGACFPLLRALRQDLSRGHPVLRLWARPRQCGGSGCGWGDLWTDRGAGRGRVVGRFARGIGLE